MSQTPVRKEASVNTLLLQRKCACGGSAGLTGKCEECDGKKLLQRRAAGLAPAAVPAIVREVLNAPGQPLDTGTHSLMKSNLGHDFSRVRIHSGARAAESARAVNALAYTVGRHIVFDEGQYAPHSADGQRLLAHELTHVAQQREQNSDSLQIQIDHQGSELEAEAHRVSEQAFNPVPGVRPVQTQGTASAPRLQRQAKRRQAGPREETVEVRWSESSDKFYERLLKAIRRSPSFRGIEVNEFQ